MRVDERGKELNLLTLLLAMKPCILPAFVMGLWAAALVKE